MNDYSICSPVLSDFSENIITYTAIKNLFINRYKKLCKKTEVFQWRLTDGISVDIKSEDS